MLNVPLKEMLKPAPLKTLLHVPSYKVTLVLYITRSQAALGTPVRGTSSLHIQSSPSPVTRSQVALGTPIRGTSVLTVLQTSPPVTRRQLALAMASEGVSGTPISPPRSVVTATKKSHRRGRKDLKMATWS